jgi:hypothetical protein
MVNADINKVLILLSRTKVMPEIKAVTAHFRGRLLFAILPPDAHEVHASLASVVRKKPDLLVYQSFDVEQNQGLQLGK